LKTKVFLNPLNDISEENIKNYINLEKELNKLSNLKKGILMVSGIIIILMSCFNNNKWSLSLSVGSLPFWLQLMIAYLINYLCAYFVHNRSYKHINKISELNASMKKIISHGFGGFNGTVLSITSPDYSIARTYKKLNQSQYVNNDENRNCSCGKHCPLSRKGNISICDFDKVKILNKFFVEFSNWNNLSFTAILATLTVIFWDLKEGFIGGIFLSFIVLRIVSRSIEIMIAFYQDVVGVNAKIFIENGEPVYISNWKNSLILKTGRISLAVHSLLEIIIVYSILYFLVNNYVLDVSRTDLFSIGRDRPFIEYLMFSGSVSVFNFSFVSYSKIYLSIMHVSQVFLSMVLIILSLARYIGLSDDLESRDEKFYLNVELNKL
jgi:hypothetical protein